MKVTISKKNSLEALDLDGVSKLNTSKTEKRPIKTIAESGKLASKELEQNAKDTEELRKKK
jgi:hypothetical protein